MSAHMTSTASAMHATPVTAPDALSGGKTASVSEMARILGGDAGLQVTALSAFVSMVRTSNPDDVDAVFRSANKEEKANGRTFAPLVYELMQTNGMDKGSASARASEGKRLWFAVKKGFSIDEGIGIGKAIANARVYLKADHERAQAIARNNAVGAKFSMLQSQLPEDEQKTVDLRGLLNTAMETVEQEAKQSEVTSLWNRANTAAGKAGQHLVPRHALPEEVARVLVALYGELFVIVLAKEAIPSVLASINAERNAKTAEGKQQAESNAQVARNEAQAARTLGKDSGHGVVSVPNLDAVTAD